MKQIEELAKAAIGFDVQRGDQFSLQNISFSLPPVDLPAPVGKFQRMLWVAERWMGLLRYVALSLLFAMVYLLILRPVKKQLLAALQAPLRTALVGSGATTGGALGGGTAEAEGGVLENEIPRTVALKKTLVMKVKEDPKGASRLIQNWLRESEAAK
jgi:flagellar M-ring protein FliF